MKYRADIDGLRTVAVLPVIFFHMGSSVFSGGYIGVDVFFVISGFLITGILHKNLIEGNFSLTEFYDRRFRRIIPAAIVVFLACLVVGWFVLTPVYYKNLGKSMIAASTFLSNIYIFGQS